MKLKKSIFMELLSKLFCHAIIVPRLKVMLQAPPQHYFQHLSPLPDIILKRHQALSSPFFDVWLFCVVVIYYILCFNFISLKSRLGLQHCQGPIQSNHSSMKWIFNPESGLWCFNCDHSDLIEKIEICGGRWLLLEVWEGIFTGSSTYHCRPSWMCGKQLFHFYPAPIATWHTVMVASSVFYLLNGNFICLEDTASLEINVNCCMFYIV